MNFGPPGVLPALFHDSAVLDEIILRLPRPAAVQTAFAGGSLVDGFGNPTSDVDVIVLVDEPLTAADLAGTCYDRRVPVDGYEVLVSSVAGRRTDVEIRLASGITTMGGQLREQGQGEPSDLYLSVAELQLLHSLRIGVPLLGAPQLAELRRTFPWNELLSHMLMRAEAEANSSIEDAAGALRAGDHGTAMLASRAALQSAVDAVLIADSETNPKPKWRVRKLERCARPELLGEYLEWEIEPVNDRAAILERARARLYRAQDMLLHVQSRVIQRA